MTYIIDSPDAISMHNEPVTPLSHRTRLRRGRRRLLVVAIVGENGGTATDLTVWTCPVLTGCTPGVT